MKRSIFVLLSVLLLLPVSSALFATVPLDGTGDCEGWTMSGTLNFGSTNNPDYMDVEYTIELFQGTVLVYSLFEQTSVHRNDANFMFNGSWGMELCGDYKLMIAFKFYGPYGTYTEYFETFFTCDCGPPPTCTFTPGYWKNHIEEWNVDGLTVGCVYYPNAELLEILNMPTEDGDITIKLFHHLVAAKLNVHNGSDNYINNWITAGDDYLCSPMHPFLSDPVDKDDAEEIKDHLEVYNEIECEEEDDNDGMLKIEKEIKIDRAAAATEESSWGSIKKKNQ